MKIWLVIIPIVMSLGCATRLPAQTDFETLVYHQEGQNRLELDLFLPENPDTSAIPLLIYVHGGGFAGGNRNEGHELARYLRNRGIAVASISYTLYMRGKDFSCGGVTSEKVKTIQIAVSETWLATAFLIERAPTFGIDPELIFLAGSSAGAETVLHASYWTEPLMNIYGLCLPADFRYAGVIGGAGAIMDINLIDENNHIPTLLFHGDQDPLVPYATAPHHYCLPTATGWLMLFGSRTIFAKLAELGGTARLFSHYGAGHEIAGRYFHRRDMQEVQTFINQVLENHRFLDHRIR